MSTAISSQPASTHLPASQAGLKPCQRSCRGLMLYFPPSPQLGTLNRDQSSSWRSKEPTCFGLSSARSGPNLDLQKLHEAREIPAGQDVDFSIVLGHAVYQTNIVTKGLPPGCMTGLEFVRFCKMTANVISGPSMSAEGAQQPGSAPSDGTPPTVLLSAVKAITTTIKGFASGFRILTSDADTNERLSKTWSNIVDFDPQQLASKFESQVHKNVGSMTKWLRELRDAVSKPKA